jgi:hypothetical protein
MRSVQGTIVLVAGLFLNPGGLAAGSQPSSLLTQGLGNAMIGQRQISGTPAFGRQSQQAGKGSGMKPGGAGCGTGQGGKGNGPRPPQLGTAMATQPATTGLATQQGMLSLRTQQGGSGVGIQQGTNAFGTQSQGLTGYGIQQGGMSFGLQSQAGSATGLQALHQAYGLLFTIVDQLQRNQIQGTAVQALRRDLQLMQQIGQTKGTLSQKTANVLQTLQQALTDLQSLVTDPNLPAQAQAPLSGALQQLQQLYQSAQQGGNAVGSQSRRGYGTQK